MASKYSINDKCRNRTRRRTRSENGVFAKATNAESEKRVSTLVKAIARGAAYSDIVQKYSAEWSVSERQVNTYWKRAQQVIIEQHQEERESHVATLTLRLDSLYEEARKSGDIRSAIAAVREKANILGAHAPNRHEISGRNGAPISHEHNNTYEQVKDSLPLEDLAHVILDVGRKLEGGKNAINCK